MRRFLRSVPVFLFVLMLLPARPGHAQGGDEEPVEDGGSEPMEGDEAEFVMPTRIELPGLEWTEGPVKFPIGSISQIDLPEGFVATDVKGTQTLMEFYGNPSSPSELATVMPAQSVDWFVVFTFDDRGYVPDDEKDDLDPDEMLEAIKAGNEHANTYRRTRGEPILTIVGWERKPAYNSTTHNLEWAIRGVSNGHPLLNFNVKILGRGGVMSANLVVDPELLEATLPTFRKLLAGFSYTKGNTYAEYRKGDKLAEYGLKGLIAGGAVAVALKTGILQKFGKYILIGLVAIGAFIKKLFTGGGGERPRRGGGTAGTDAGAAT